MGILRRNKEESDKSLLTSQKNKRGFLGLRRSSDSGGRSDTHGEHQLGLSSAAHWGKVRAPPRTPPLSPDEPYSSSNNIQRAPVSNVTLVKGNGMRNSKANGINGKKVIQSDSMPADDRTEYSDLTDNRTLQRLNEQKKAYEQALKEKYNRDQELRSLNSQSVSVDSRSSAASVLKGKTRRKDIDDPVVCTQEQQEKSFFAELFGFMDNACRLSDEDPQQAESIASFAPEWGVAPTFEETSDKRKKQQEAQRSSSIRKMPPRSMADTLDETITRGEDSMTLEDDTYTDMSQSKTASPSEMSRSRSKSTSPVDSSLVTPERRPPRSTAGSDMESTVSPRSVHHENFEMVLEELEEEEYNPKKRKNWMKNPFNRSKRDKGDEKEGQAPVPKPQTKDELQLEKKRSATGPPRSSKAHQDMVKQALFPDYNDEDSETDDEEKKEEVSSVQQKSALSIEKKRSSVSANKKGIFSSLRRGARGKPTLEPVQEDRPSTPKELHLIGARPRSVQSVTDDVVEEIYRDLEVSSADAGDSSYNVSNEMKYKPKPSNAKPAPATVKQTAAAPTRAPEEKVDPEGRGFVGGIFTMISETVGAAVHPGKPVPEEVENIAVRQPQNLQQSTTLKVISKKKEDPETKEHTNDLRRTESAPQTVSNKALARRKPVWKEVKDQKTGRSYYYHRVTRETTWTRPKEMDDEDQKESEEQGVEQQPGRRNPEEHLDVTKRQQSTNTKNSATSRKLSARDFQPKTWEKRQEITLILQTIGPPDGKSIDGLLAQYEGREDELLAHARKMKESRPFDEPLATEDDDADERNDQLHDLNETIRTDSSRNSLPRSQSGVTSRLSESTQQIANTRNRGPRAYESVSGGTSLSSHGASIPRTSQPQPVYRIPSKIPAPRRDRELMVEEFTQDRKSETFNNDTRLPVAESSQESNASASIRRRPFTTPSYTAPKAGPATIEEEQSHDDLSSHANDTVSALSVNEMEFADPTSQLPPNDTRRRALDDAIRRGDWNMAAAISEEMKTVRSKQESSGSRHEPGEWKQSELDKFISENDWEAVSEYIAHLRTKQDRRGGARSPVSEMTGPDIRSKGRYSDMITQEKSGKQSNSVRRRRGSGGDPAYEDDSDDSGERGHSRPHSRDRGVRSSSGGRETQRRKVIPVTRSFSSESTSDDYTEEYSSESSSSAFQTVEPRLPSHSRKSGGRGKKEFRC